MIINKTSIDPVDKTIKTYDQMADDYRLRYQKLKDQNHMQPLLDKFIGMLSKDRKILDIGSGVGFDAKYLSDHRCKVTSIDLSDKLLEIAREIVPDVEFIKMDMRSMTFQSRSFNGIWASASLLHIPKNQIRKVLIEIYRIIKSSGVLFIAIKQGDGERFVINKGKGNLPGAKRYFAYYQKEEFEKLLEKVGFRIIEYKTNINRGNVWMNFFCKK